LTELFEPTSFALAIDARVRALPEGLDPARLFGVRLRAAAPGDFVLVPFWSGVAREIPAWLCPPRDVVAIALDTSGWAAPLDAIAAHGRPSRHPQRRRIRHTAIVYGAGQDISVLRYDDDAEPRVLDGAVGVVYELLVACWARRPAA
jgi:hypothetical protein